MAHPGACRPVREGGSIEGASDSGSGLCEARGCEARGWGAVSGRTGAGVLKALGIAAGAGDIGAGDIGAGDIGAGDIGAGDIGAGVPSDGGLAGGAEKGAAGAASSGSGGKPIGGKATLGGIAVGGMPPGGSSVGTESGRGLGATIRDASNFGGSATGLAGTWPEANATGAAASIESLWTESVRIDGSKGSVGGPATVGSPESTGAETTGAETKGSVTKNASGAPGLLGPEASRGIGISDGNSDGISGRATRGGRLGASPPSGPSASEDTTIGLAKTAE